MYDYHTHSHFSSDCKTELSQMVEAALSRGIREIAITDHIDLDYAGTDIEFEFSVPSQQKIIEEMNQIHKGKIKVLKGIEMGIQPHVLTECESIVRKTQPDFVIASMHVCNKKDLYNGDFFKDVSALEAAQIFFNELNDMLCQYTAYSVVGHLDIIKRYNESFRAMAPETIKQLVEPVLKTIIRQGKGIEINTSGLRQGLDETLPNFEIAELYYELGGRVMTLGSDAHRREEVGHSFETVLDSLQRIGFKEIWTFDRMQPKPVKIKSL